MIPFGWQSLEVETDLAAEDEGVVQFVRAARVHDVLNVGLEKEGALAEGKTVCPFQNRFVVLRANSRVEQLLAVLRVAEVAAEVVENDVETG